MEELKIKISPFEGRIVVCETAPRTLENKSALEHAAQEGESPVSFLFALVRVGSQESSSLGLLL
jgi:hypothetical protein